MVMQKIFTGTVIMCIAVLAAYRGYGIYSAHVEKVNARKEKNTMFAVVNAEPVPPQSSLPAANAQPLKEITGNYYGDVPDSQALIMQQEKEYSPRLPKISGSAQTQEKAERVFEKFNNNPLIKQFNDDLLKAGIADMDFNNMAGADFSIMLRERPQLREIFMKYAQDPRFIQLIQDMAKDPEVREISQELRKK